MANFFESPKQTGYFEGMNHKSPELLIKGASVLLIDDDADILNLYLVLRDEFNGIKFRRFEIASSEKEARDKIDASNGDLDVAFIDFKGVDGDQIAYYLEKINPNCQRVLISASVNIKEINAKFNGLFHDSLEKPFDIDDFEKKMKIGVLASRQRNLVQPEIQH